MQRYFRQLARLFKPKPIELEGRKLYAACVDQARRPVFYLDYGVEDAIGARFELLTFHVALVIERLKAVATDDPRHAQAHDLAQAVFDAFLGALDNTLREQGTGDLSVPKKMKRLGTVIYTRMKRWDELWNEDAAARVNYAARTVFAGSDYNDEEASGDGAMSEDVLRRAAAFAAYADAARAQLDVDGLLRGQAVWADAPALEQA